MSAPGGWVGVDLDGTLAHYTEWKGPEHIGAPVPLMVERVKKMIAAGVDVRIFTARVGGHDSADNQLARSYVKIWCMQHLGVALPVTAQKDYGMSQLWDDRCVQIIPNTGMRADGQA